MAKEKKRLSKTAKTALKLLNDSKLLANAKNLSESKAEQNFKSTDNTTAKTSAPNKVRPEKKRG